MKIVKLQAENVKKLKAVQIAPEGNIVKITGRNEQGKTTVLDSIWWALGGTKDIQEQPIRDGQKSARITVDLGDYVAIRTFTPSGTTLKVENKDGFSAKSPQALLDGLLGRFTFNPLEFMKADKTKQVETLLNIVDLKVDNSKLKELSGYEPRENSNPLAVINEAYKYVYDERTAANRDLERTKKVLESLPQGVNKTERVSLVELVAEKDRLEKENRDNDEKRETLSLLNIQAQNTLGEINSVKEQIKTLQDKLAGLEKDYTTKTDKVNQYTLEIASLKDNDLTEITEKIAKADETNQKADQWEAQERVIADVTGYQQEVDFLNKRLDNIKAYKQELVSNAKFPIEGLDFGNGGVLYQGLPFEQASTAQKLRVSLAIAMALNPTLRVIRIDDASLLDSTYIKIIEEMAAENDFQIWMEIVDESGKVGVYIEDGEVKAAPDENDGLNLEFAS